MTAVDVRPARDDERGWLREIVKQRWGDELIVGRGRAHRVDELPALVALDRGERVGLLTYCMDGGTVEIVTLDSLREGVGVGRALIEGVAAEAQGLGGTRLLVMTTNDNLNALGFYQRVGFRLAELRPGAVHEARRIKPSIPHVGHHEVPIRDELDLIRDLTAASLESTPGSAP